MNGKAMNLHLDQDINYVPDLANFWLLVFFFCQILLIIQQFGGK